MTYSRLFPGLAVLLSSATLSAQVFTFQSEEFIAVASLADAKPVPRKLAKGYDPAISPDGQLVAYTQSDEQGDRRIGIIEVATGKASLVEGIPGKNEFMAMWSSDGSRLLFSHFKESDWSLASVSAKGGGFSIVIDQGVRQVAGYAPIANGQEWLCHDLESFFIVTPKEGQAGSLRDLPKSKGLDGLSMPSRIAVSPDGKTALFDQDMNGEGGPEVEEPIPAVFLIEIATGKLTRLTAKGVWAGMPTWLPGGKEFLFSGFDSKAEQASIYRMAAEPSAQPALVLHNASNPSAAAR